MPRNTEKLTDEQQAEHDERVVAVAKEDALTGVVETEGQDYFPLPQGGDRANPQTFGDLESETIDAETLFGKAFLVVDYSTYEGIDGDTLAVRVQLVPGGQTYIWSTSGIVTMPQIIEAKERGMLPLVTTLQPVEGKRYYRLA